MTEPPFLLNDARVLRYKGDPAADWDAPCAFDDGPTFQGEVTAIAIVEDESTGGVFSLYLYADGSIADEWQASLEDAVEAEAEGREIDLPWVVVAPE